MTDTHYLIVHESPHDGMDIEHLPSCPTSTEYDGRVKTHTCAIGQIESIGEICLSFRRNQDAASDGSEAWSEYVPPGRHPIEYWFTHNPRTGEFEAGLRLIRDGGAA